MRAPTQVVPPHEAVEHATAPAPVTGTDAVFAGVGLGSIVLGALLTYGSTSEVSNAKLFYAGLLAVVVVLALARAIRRPAPVFSHLGAFPVWAAAAALLVMFSGVLLSAAPDLQTAVRQGLFYVLVPVLPFVGAQLGSYLGPKALQVCVVVLGVVSAVSVGVDFIARRGVSALTIDRVVLGSPSLAALGFAVALLCAVRDRGWLRLLGILAILIIPLFMLITGTRTNLIFFLIPLGLLGRRGRGRLSVGSVLTVSAIAVVSALAVVLVAPYVLTSTEFLTSRISAVTNLFTSGVETDLSYGYRQQQSAYAQQMFADAPWLGQGLTWRPETSLDTPYGPLAKVGSLGVITVLLGMIGWLRLARRLTLMGVTGIGVAATGGFVVFFLALIPFGSAFEDRGFTLALLLLAACMSSEYSAWACKPAPEPSTQATVPEDASAYTAGKHGR